MEIFGNDIYNIVIFIAIIVLGVFVGKIVDVVVKNYLKKIISKTKTKFDDIILDALDVPIIVLVITAFFYFGLRFLVLPDHVFKLMDEAVKVVVILSATYFAVKFIDGIFEHYLIPLTEKTETESDEHIVKPLKKIVKILTIILGILTALSSVGYDITALLAGLGVGGLAVALAMQDTIKNFIAGILILMDKPFSINHWIKVDDVEGIVEEIGIRSTRIRTFDHTLITVPNSKLLDSAIENLTVRDRRRVLTTIGLTYNTPVEKIKKAKEIIKDIVENHPATLPPYRIHFTEYGDWSLNLRVEYFVRNISFEYFLNAVDEINLKIKEEFEKEGIEMAFPTYTVYLEKDNS
ncbi:mechanosensitive ion channel family protein [Methanocaldococcus fervens]|uniref:MscS Mechanosensitive ion channel n=1 Tax=Methanocaldococcus fervens (strain DSM 4213 / JCM 15782 / AG86) TaxID=573064 RepID=C7P7N3_METFA|nr:mechanosensitive ion channel family protein [Methanocaldococcus fervens]ACV24565.1 MscS Mechanosensitive ion channel [Methanocaldococcus fervens AG86]